MMCSSYRRGSVLIYYTFVMLAVLAIAFLAVDWGHANLAKVQAQGAADAAALYAANGVIAGTPASVRARAVSAAFDNKVDGVRVAVLSADVEFGLWDPSIRVFQVLDAASEYMATAVRVTVHCSKARSTAVPLSFGGAFGVKSVDITATATATIGNISGAYVAGVASPWLAGMPSGSVVPKVGWNSKDTVAPASWPVSFPIRGTASFRFAKTTGSTSWTGGGTYAASGTGAAGPDGDNTSIAVQAACNGINTTKAPLNAVMGIFLNNTAPNTTAQAATLDYTTAASRDFASSSPGLKQIFFIGDGLNSADDLQTFNVPAGATRLYIGFMDQQGWWWDNVGGIQFTAVQGNTAMLVK